VKNVTEELGEEVIESGRKITFAFKNSNLQEKSRDKRRT